MIGLTALLLDRGSLLPLVLLVILSWWPILWLICAYW